MAQTAQGPGQFLISTPWGFVGAGLGLAVAWTVWPGGHWFLGVLVLVLLLGLVLAHGPEIGRQFTAIAGWNGTRSKV